MKIKQPPNFVIETGRLCVLIRSDEQAASFSGAFAHHR